LTDVNRIPIGAFMNPDPNPQSPNYNQLMPVSKITGTVLQDYFPLTHYTSMNVIRHGAWANYNAMQVSWSRQQGALTYNLNYTWSKTLGINGTEDPINIHNDYGILGQDRTHVFNASYAYEVGNRFNRSRLEATVLNGWMISGISSIQSGAPLQESYSMNFGLGGTNTLSSDQNSVNSTFYLGSSSYSLEPKLTCDPSAGRKNGQLINPNCFSLPTMPQFDSNGVLTGLGGQGPYQWPYLRGPAYFTNDLSLSRTIKVSERQSAQIKFTGMNFLNHALKSFDQNNNSNINLNFQNGVFVTSGAGWAYGIPNEKFGRRVLEISARYNF
jgi:hypothetical protein